MYGIDVTFRASTFSEHLKRWNNASPSARARFIDAGQTEDGRYFHFMKANPAPGAEVKAARKRLQRKGDGL